MSDDYLTRCLWKGVADTEQQQEASYRIEQLEDNLRTFFRLLDLTEESDEGRPFHPITISCCRELDGLKMEKVLAQLKNIVKGSNT